MTRLRNILLAPFLIALSAAAAPESGADPTDTALATVGGDDAAVAIDIYEDYLCPYSAAFEREFGDQIGRAVADGKLQARYHMLHFLDPRSASGDYSSRAAGAALAVFEHNPERFAALHAQLFAKWTQPQEHGASDWSDNQLAQIAHDLGADDAAVAEIESGDEAAAAHDAGERSADELREAIGEVSVPTVVAHGKKVDVDDKNWLGKLVG